MELIGAVTGRWDLFLKHEQLSSLFPEYTVLSMFYC